MNYVSNSSSSSYIISYNEGACFQSNGLKITVEKFINHIESNSNWDSECTEIKAKGKELVCKAIKEWWYDDKQNFADKVLEIKEDNVVYLQISYRDELIQDLFTLFTKNDVIKVFYDER